MVGVGGGMGFGGGGGRILFLGPEILGVQSPAFFVLIKAGFFLGLWPSKIA